MRPSNGFKSQHDLCDMKMQTKLLATYTLQRGLRSSLGLLGAGLALGT